MKWGGVSLMARFLGKDGAMTYLDEYKPCPSDFDFEEQDQSEEEEVDLSVDPERMLAIRDGVRGQFVERYHALRMAARVLRRFGSRREAIEKAEEAERILLMIKALEAPAELPGQ